MVENVAQGFTRRMEMVSAEGSSPFRHLCLLSVNGTFIQVYIRTHAVRGDQGAAEKMTLYSSREAELQELRESITAEKNKLHEEMTISDERQESYRQVSEAAHRRNQALLRDLRKAEKTLKRRSQVAPNHTLMKLENHYWKSVEQELPKWEQFLLGKSQLPFGMKENQQKVKHSQTMQTPKSKNLPPSGYSSSTFPR